MKHLTLSDIDLYGFNFASVNAETLISLELDYIENIEDIKWPQFPRLRELSIVIEECLPILLKCNATLECLTLGSMLVSYIDETNAVEIPKMERLVKVVVEANTVGLDFDR